MDDLVVEWVSGGVSGDSRGVSMSLMVSGRRLLGGYREVSRVFQKGFRGFHGNSRGLMGVSGDHKEVQGNFRGSPRVLRGFQGVFVGFITDEPT